MFKLEQLFIKKTKEFDYVHPVSGEKCFSLVMYSHTTKEYKDAALFLSDNNKESEEESNAILAKFLAMITGEMRGLEFNGKEVGSDKKAIEAVYSQEEALLLRNFAMSCVGSPSNFLPNVEKA